MYRHMLFRYFTWNRLILRKTYSSIITKWMAGSGSGGYYSLERSVRQTKNTDWEYDVGGRPIYFYPWCFLQLFTLTHMAYSKKKRHDACILYPLYNVQTCVICNAYMQLPSWTRQVQKQNWKAFTPPCHPRCAGTWQGGCSLVGYRYHFLDVFDMMRQ